MQTHDFRTHPLLTMKPTHRATLRTLRPFRCGGIVMGEIIVVDDSSTGMTQPVLPETGGADHGHGKGS